MINFKEKSQVFIIGVMVGLIIAGGFFILKLDDYFKELNFYKNVAKTFYLHSKSTESVIRTEDVKYVDEIKSNKISTKRRSNFIVDSSNVRNSEIAAISDSDSLNHHLEKDTLLLYNNVSEEIVVRKDELLSNKTLEVINLNPLVSLANYSDSLLQKVSGVRDDRNNTKQYFNIELWQSPLNYRGYKMSKYKIVLYGLLSAEGLKVYKIDDDIYLKNSSTIYKLDQSSDFKPYQNITDQLIINKLK